MYLLYYDISSGHDPAEPHKEYLLISHELVTRRVLQFNRGLEVRVTVTQEC